VLCRAAERDDRATKRTAADVVSYSLPNEPGWCCTGREARTPPHPAWLAVSTSR